MFFGGRPFCWKNRTVPHQGVFLLEIWGENVRPSHTKNTLQHRTTRRGSAYCRVLIKSQSRLLHMNNVQVQFMDWSYLPWHFLYFNPLPHGQGSFLPTLGRTFSLSSTSLTRPFCGSISFMALSSTSVYPPLPHILVLL